jgi:hypothetical protein
MLRQPLRGISEPVVRRQAGGLALSRQRQNTITLMAVRGAYRRVDSKGRFFVVTFTRAAGDELRARLLNRDFAFVASAIEVVTLNGWGFKSVRANHHSPRLLASEFEKSDCVRNILQPVWRTGCRARALVVEDEESRAAGLCRRRGRRHRLAAGGDAPA